MIINATNLPGVKPFHEAFRDKIDMYLGTVVLTESQYEAIQADAFAAGHQQGLLHAAKLVASLGGGPKREELLILAVRDAKPEGDMIYE